MHNRKRNIVFVGAGDNSLHEKFFSAESGTRDFDIFVFYYGNNDVIADRYRQNCTYFARGKASTPRHAFYTIFSHKADIFDTYSQVWITDDDLDISESDLNKLFSIGDQFDLFIYQPSIGKYASWQALHKQHGNILRFVSFVDQQCPIFKTSILKKIVFTMSSDFSMAGWGIEYIWSWVLGKPTNKIAIIDAITAIHARPFGSDYSRFSIHPREEMMISIYPKFKDAIDWATQDFSTVNPVEYGSIPAVSAE